MEKKFIKDLFRAHQEAPDIPEPSLVCNWLEALLGFLFPEFSNHRYASVREFEQHSREIELELHRILLRLEKQLPSDIESIEQNFISKLPAIRLALLKDAQATLQGDPAAVNLTEVVRTYPGFYAIAVYRLAHLFYNLEVPLIPRILTEYAHSKTGIDIHPGAIIGQGLCIDHGTGVVIGETCQIGERVKIYQGVTLGALSVKKEMAKTKRHPTIEDGVIIYAGATILGGETIIGKDAIVGGNVWITESVPAGARIYYNVYKTGQIKTDSEYSKV
ncbi:MAG TPA: serine O-acetyltransferase EpsC [Saprospiraceae bacterium]|nr:serine O-acetyltransferase EpsC [Saprospiraceae bacterium]